MDVKSLMGFFAREGAKFVLVEASRSGRFRIQNTVTFIKPFLRSPRTKGVVLSPDEMPILYVMLEELEVIGFFTGARIQEKDSEAVPGPTVILTVIMLPESLPSLGEARQVLRDAALAFLLADPNASGQIEGATARKVLIHFCARSLALRDAWKERSLARVWGTIDAIGRLNEEIDTALLPISDRVQKFLDTQEGKSFESFEENQRIAAMIQATVARLGKAIACPKDGCGKPAKLRCRQPPRSLNGVFQFEHEGEDGKQTNHGGYTSLPPMKLTNPPIDRRKRVSTDSAEAS